MNEHIIPSKAILDLARKIEYEKTGRYTPSYQTPAIDYQMTALLVWLDEYSKARQSELFLPTIQQENEK